MMVWYIIVAALSTLVAGLCIPAILFWGLGVPGIAGSFADGWTMGLMVLIFYPVSYAVVYGASFVVWILYSYHKVSQPAHSRWQQITTVIAIAFLLTAVFRLQQAFRVMSQ